MLISFSSLSEIDRLGPYLRQTQCVAVGRAVFHRHRLAFLSSRELRCCRWPALDNEMGVEARDAARCESRCGALSPLFHSVLSLTLAMSERISVPSSPDPGRGDAYVAADLQREGF